MLSAHASNFEKLKPTREDLKFEQRRDGMIVSVAFLGPDVFYRRVLREGERPWVRFFSGYPVCLLKYSPKPRSPRGTSFIPGILSASPFFALSTPAAKIYFQVHRYRLVLSPLRNRVRAKTLLRVSSYTYAFRPVLTTLFFCSCELTCTHHFRPTTFTASIVMATAGGCVCKLSKTVVSAPVNGLRYGGHPPGPSRARVKRK